ncbi:MAG TPA: radical SAM protein [Phycisphaerales bacterium]|nr:radical SAM protein [Phycisphaerales bacterium]
MKVCLVLTHQCNLACSYCYAGKKFNRHMSDETAWKGLKLLLQGTGDMELSFFGGEPFLRYDTMVAMSRVARGAARRSGRRLSIQVTTNATILEEKQLRFLEDYQVWTAFSVDGPEEIQDVARPFTNGRGSGRLVWRNIERALERLSRVHILMVVAPQTVDHLLPAVERLYRAGAGRISLLPDLEADWSRAEDKLREVWPQLARITLLSMLTDQPLHLAPFSSYFPTTDRFHGEVSGKCDFGGEQVTIAPSGNFYPCARLVGADIRTDVRVGDIRSGYDISAAQALKQCGEDALRQGGCGKGGCQCIALMPGDVKGQLHWSGEFARWTSEAAAPVAREIEEALGTKPSELVAV